MSAPKLTVVDHPLLQDKLARLRDKRTPPGRFRALLAEAGAMLGYEAIRSSKSVKAKVTTPLKTTEAQVLAQPLVFVAILRAGLGLLDGLQRLEPETPVGHIGLYRNEDTLNPVRYYVRLPPVDKAFTLLVDPMLATGGSAVEAIEILKSEGAKHITLVTLVSSKFGIKRVHEKHPDVAIVTAAVDAELNKKGYIVPGLGDAGDRVFGT